jgi:hypothetical protein
MRWNVRLDAILRPDITVAVRLAPDNQQAMDYYLLPKWSWLHLGSALPSAMESFSTPTASTRSTDFLKSAVGRA